MDQCCKRAREEDEQENEEEEEEEEEEESIEQMRAFTVAVTGFIAAVVAWSRCKLLARREPLPDLDVHRRFYMHRLCGSEVECMENLRVSRYGFSKLCQVLYDKGGLRRTKHVSIEESVAMFLNILGHNVKYRSIHLNFYRSKETISRQLNRV